MGKGRHSKNLHPELHHAHRTYAVVLHDGSTEISLGTIRATSERDAIGTYAVFQGFESARALERAALKPGLKLSAHEIETETRLEIVEAAHA